MASAPATLNDGIFGGPLWLQAWVLLLVVTNLAAVAFIVRREEGRPAVRALPIGILLSFFLAAAFMDWIFGRVGFVRLLGLAHLVCWGPVYAWAWSRRAEIGTDTAYGKYIHAYLLIAGISLVIDVTDVLRYLAGDGAL